MTQKLYLMFQKSIRIKFQYLISKIEIKIWDRLNIGWNKAFYYIEQYVEREGHPSPKPFEDEEVWLSHGTTNVVVYRKGNVLKGWRGLTRNIRVRLELAHLAGGALSSAPMTRALTQTQCKWWDGSTRWLNGPTRMPRPRSWPGR